jgi:anti-sigma factor RsiW
MSHNLSCEQCRSLLPWYVNESLSADERTAIDRHVITCAQCRKDLAEWREMAAAAQYARRVRQPPALSQMILWEALQAHIAEGHAPDERRDRALTLANDVEELLPTTAPPPRQINRRKVPAVAAVILALAVVVAFVAIFRTLGHRVAATSSTIILSLMTT